MQRHRRNFVLRLDALDKSSRLRLKEVNGFPGGGRNKSAVRVDFARANDAVNIVFVNHLARAQIPPSELLIIASGEKRVGIGPNDRLDAASVGARADFDRGFGTFQVVNAQLLFLTTGGHVGGGRRKSDGADNVIVLKGLEAFAGESVPNLAMEGSAYGNLTHTQGSGRTLKSRRNQ